MCWKSMATRFVILFTIKLRTIGRSVQRPLSWLISLSQTWRVNYFHTTHCLFIWFEISFMKTACHLLLLIFAYVHQKIVFEHHFLLSCLLLSFLSVTFVIKIYVLKLKFTYRVEHDQSTQIMQKENSNINFRMQQNEAQAQLRWDLTLMRTRLTMKMIMTLKMMTLSVAPMNNLHAKIKSAFQLFSDVTVSITA